VVPYFVPFILVVVHESGELVHKFKEVKRDVILLLRSSNIDHFSYDGGLLTTLFSPPFDKSVLS